MSGAYIDVSKVECPICHDIFQDACETSCGHGFCEYCLNLCLESKPGVCPVCLKNPSPVHPSFTLRAIVDGVKLFNENEQYSASSSSTSSSCPSKEIEREKAAGNTCYNQRKYAEAIMHYSKALQVPRKSTGNNKGDAVLYNNRAQCYIKLEEFRRALDDCDEAIRLDNTDVKAHMRRGLCLYKLGDFESSRVAYLKVKQLDTSGTWTDVVNESLAALPNPRPSPPPTAHQYQQQPAHQPPPFQHQQQANRHHHRQYQQQQQQQFNYQQPPRSQHFNPYPGYAGAPPPAPRYANNNDQGPVACTTQ